MPYNNLEAIKVNNGDPIYNQPLSNVFFKYPTYMYYLCDEPNQDGTNVSSRSGAHFIDKDYRCLKISADIISGTGEFFIMGNYNPTTQESHMILRRISFNAGQSINMTITYEYCLTLRTSPKQTQFWPQWTLITNPTIVRINYFNYSFGKLIEGLTVLNSQTSLRYFDTYEFGDSITTSPLATGCYIVSQGTCNINGYLDHIMVFKSIPRYAITFFVGFIDQRNIFVSRYEIHPSSSYHQNNYFYAFDKNTYDIRANETICAYVSSGTFLEITDASSSLKHTKYTTNLNEPLTDGGFYSPIEFAVLPSSNSDIDITTELNSINASISDLYNRNATTTDENGSKYELVIRNGEIVPISNDYSKCLCLGNSLTSHGYAENIGYYGDSAWAMASTNKVETTWSYHLEKILKQKNALATCTPFNIFTWETNYMNCDFDDLFSNMTDDYDLIIMRAGENGTAGSDYEQGTDRLITYLRTRWPEAVIIMSDMFWHNQTKETAMKNTASKFGLQYVTFGSIADNCDLGQMLMGRDNSFHPVINSGVSGHCTDVCFFNYANILANTLKYSQITGKHTVSVNTSSQYKINNIYQIHNGYVTILTYGNSQPSSMVVKDSSQNTISVQHISLSNVSWQSTPNPVPTFASVFKMPDLNVTVTF